MNPNHDPNSSPEPVKTQPVDWVAVSVIAMFHLSAAFAIVYVAAIHTSLWSIGLGLVWLVLCGLSITAGYHRLFSHPTYKTNAAVRALHLLFGAASAQGPALRWAASHRIHHAKVDDVVADPYSIRRGFMWAHIGWVLRKPQPPGSRSTDRVVKDLRKDPLIRMQERFYMPTALLMGLGVPAAIGMAWGDPIGALLVAGPLRLVLQWHATWAVNSVAHSIGTRPYSTSSSARDSLWTALITFGEGYHNYHHRFQADYRNGIRWYHYDPTKWFVWTLARLGLAHDLRRVAPARIAQAREEVSANGSVT